MATSLLSISSCLLHPQSRRVSEVARRSSSFYGRREAKQVSVALHDGRHASASPILSVFGFGKTKKVTKRETIIPDPDYTIPVVLLGIAGGLAYTDNIGPAVPIGILGLFLLFQTTRVKFVFDDEALEVKVGDKLEDSGENAFVGGKNRWKYSTFVNWEFWWPNFPVLVYFKEIQTSPMDKFTSSLFYLMGSSFMTPWWSAWALQKPADPSNMFSCIVGSDSNEL